jgi:hypothetical protein
MVHLNEAPFAIREYRTSDHVVHPAEAWRAHFIFQNVEWKGDPLPPPPSPGGTPYVGPSTYPRPLRTPAPLTSPVLYALVDEALKAKGTKRSAQSAQGLGLLNSRGRALGATLFFQSWARQLEQHEAHKRHEL